MTWKTYPGIDSSVEFNDKGQVRRSTWDIKNGVKRRLLPGSLSKSGKRVYTLKYHGLDTSFQLDRVIGELFCPDFEPHLRARHLNGDKQDCSAQNLKWVPVSEVCRGPETTHSAKLSRKEAEAIRASGKSIEELMAQYGVRRRVIYNVLKNKTWKKISGRA